VFSFAGLPELVRSLLKKKQLEEKMKFSLANESE
jgi:hypothetical protein